MEEEYAKYLLTKTRQDYNLIASDYARTRNFVWDIKDLSQYAVPGEKILDLGCGNGRLLETLKDKKVDYTGLDFSQKLIDIAKKNYPGEKFLLGEGLNLPFPDGFFDKVFSIRVLHHVPSKKFQASFLEEVKRVLKPNGLLILTVWYLWKLRSKKNFILMLKNAALKIIGQSKLDFGDALIPWDKKALRYYHYFTKRELRMLAEESGLKVKEMRVTPCDIYLIAEKPSE